MATTNDRLLREQLHRLNQLIKLDDLNTELMGAFTVLLTWVIDYCKKNNIPIHDEQSLKMLISRVKRLHQEIKIESSDLSEYVKFQKMLQCVSDESLQRDRSDEDLTEPEMRTL